MAFFSSAEHFFIHTSKYVESNLQNSSFTSEMRGIGREPNSLLNFTKCLHCVERLSKHAALSRGCVPPTSGIDVKDFRSYKCSWNDTSFISILTIKLHIDVFYSLCSGVVCRTKMCSLKGR